MKTVQTPIPDGNGYWLCPCGLVYDGQLLAVRCCRKHSKQPAAADQEYTWVNRIPGDAMRTSYQPRREPLGGPTTQQRRDYPWPLLVLAVVCLAIVCGLLATALRMPAASPPPAYILPSATTAPCPRGGVTCYGVTR